MTNNGELQARWYAWHQAKYGTVTLEQIGNKLGEESGEVNRAITRVAEIAVDLRDYSDFPDKYTALEHWREEMAKEIGDTALVLMRLSSQIGRHFTTVVSDRAEEVMAR